MGRYFEVTKRNEPLVNARIISRLSSSMCNMLCTDQLTNASSTSDKSREALIGMALLMIAACESVIADATEDEIEEERQRMLHAYDGGLADELGISR